MDAEATELLAWARTQREEAVRQIDLFSSGGIKAQLLMPDGNTQDITAGVLAHQDANVLAFTRLENFLKK